MEKLPANLIDDAIITAAEAFNTAKEQLSDGFQITDLFPFIQTFMNVQNLVEHKDELVAQLKDYSLTERAASIDKLKEKVTFTDDVEEIIGIVYDVALGIVRGIVYLTNKPA